MAMSEQFQIGTKSHLLTLNIHRGHFATSHSHINYYIDVTPQKTDLAHAKAIAKALSEYYSSSVLVDTILCLDGMEVVATCLADELTNGGLLGVNCSTVTIRARASRSSFTALPIRFFSAEPVFLP